MSILLTSISKMFMYCKTANVLHGYRIEGESTVGMIKGVGHEIAIEEDVLIKQ